MVEVHVLVSVLVGVGVVQDPLVAGQIAAMPVPCHDALADDLDLV